MTDHDGFETRLAARLTARAALGDRPFDREAITRAAVMRGHASGPVSRRLPFRAGRIDRPIAGRLAFIAMLLALALALAGLALVAGRGLFSPDPIPAERGVFIQLGIAPYHHDGYTATLLHDGRVLVAGGSEGDSAEVWDPATRAFTATGSPAFPGGLVAALLRDGRVLVVGGGRDGTATEIWDPATGAFVLGPILASRDTLSAPPMLLSDGRVLFGHGPSAEVFDPVSGTLAVAGPVGDTFRPAAPTHPALVSRAGCGRWPPGTSVVLRDGRVLTVGGSGSVGHSCPPLDSAEIWDPRTGESTLTRPMPEAMSYSTATLLQDGDVLIVPGDEGRALLFTFR
jgi:hypothetical protein